MRKDPNKRPSKQTKNKYVHRIIYIFNVMSLLIDKLCVVSLPVLFSVGVGGGATLTIDAFQVKQILHNVISMNELALFKTILE